MQIFVYNVVFLLSYVFLLNEFSERHIEGKYILRDIFPLKKNTHTSKTINNLFLYSAAKIYNYTDLQLRRIIDYIQVVFRDKLLQVYFTCFPSYVAFDLMFRLRLESEWVYYITVISEKKVTLDSLKRKCP